MLQDDVDEKEGRDEVYLSSDTICIINLVGKGDTVEKVIWALVSIVTAVTLNVSQHRINHKNQSEDSQIDEPIYNKSKK